MGSLINSRENVFEQHPDVTNDIQSTPVSSSTKEAVSSKSSVALSSQ